jgi:uncharacterized protein YndB with AHSA1/START domain
MPKFERRVEIEAPIEKVWAVMSDPGQWPQWFPGIEAVSNVSAVTAGGSFEWQDEGRTGHGTIVRVEPRERLEIVTQMGDDKDSHVFELRAKRGLLGGGSGECRVEYTLDTLMGGGILANFVAGGNPKDMLRVKNALNRLKELAEGQGS